MHKIGWSALDDSDLFKIAPVLLCVVSFAESVGDIPGSCNDRFDKQSARANNSNENKPLSETSKNY